MLPNENTLDDTFFKTWLDKIFSISFWNKTHSIVYSSQSHSFTFETFWDHYNLKFSFSSQGD